MYSRELRSNSSGGLRSGRKFILQDVPCLPPLTPYCSHRLEIIKIMAIITVSLATNDGMWEVWEVIT